MNEPVIKTCPSCGGSFECRMTAIDQCPCSRVQLTTEDRSLISGQFADCLCPACLEKYSRASA